MCNYIIETKRNTKKGLEDHEQVKNLFKPKLKTSEPMIITMIGSTSSNASHTKSLDACFQDSAFQKAKITWELKHLYNELSANSSKDVVDPFKTMFPDSKVAEKMQLKRKKLKNVVNHGISPML